MEDLDLDLLNYHDHLICLNNPGDSAKYDLWRSSLLYQELTFLQFFVTLKLKFEFDAQTYEDR